MIRPRPLIGLVALTFALLSVAPAPQSYDFTPVRQHIRSVLQERNLASVSVAVSRGDRVLWAESFGLADVERNIAATPDTPYSLASISKPFTATAMMTLVEGGRVQLDAPMNDYLGQVRLSDGASPASRATVRRVLSHTAGLPLHYQFFYAGESRPPVTIVEAISRHGVVMFEPGEVYEYSNLGYGIVGHAVATVAGETYERVMRTRVFQPLGLMHTSVGADGSMTPAAAVRHGGNKRPIAYYTTDHPGASEIYSSARDLVRFGMFHLGHDLDGMRAILSRQTRMDMQQRATPAGGAEYGFGWGIAQEHGYRKISHTGSMPGVSTLLALYPDWDVAIVVLINSLDRDHRIEIGRVIAEAVIPGYAEARMRDGLGRQVREAAPSRGRGAGRAATRPALTGEWTGTLRTWKGTLPMTLRAEADGRVLARIGEEPEGPVAGVRLADGFLTGRLTAALDVPDLARATAYSVQLRLRVSDDRIAGQATALSSGDPLLFALSSFVDLRPRRPPTAEVVFVPANRAAGPRASN